GHVSGDAEGPTHILAAFRGAGQLLMMPYWTSMIAETHAAAGRWDPALKLIEDCIQEADAIGELQSMPELLRLKGTFLLQRDAGAAEAAETCFRKAIDLACAQQSRMLELRSLTSLGTLLKTIGRADEIRGQIEQLCSEITEGSELPDLK